MNAYREFINNCFEQLVPPGTGTPKFRKTMWHAHTAGMLTVVEFLNRSKGLDDLQIFIAEITKIMEEDLEE